jgi:hypothetical protein
MSVGDEWPDSKAAGKRVEAEVVQVVDGIEPVSDDDARADSRATTAMYPSQDLPFSSICVVESGTPVEIKSAMVRATAANERGRYYLRRDQHEFLLNQRAVYLLAVCKPTPQREILSKRIVPAAVVNEFRHPWKTPDDRPAYDQLAWSVLIDSRRINGGESA